MSHSEFTVFESYLREVPLKARFVIGVATELRHFNVTGSHTASCVHFTTLTKGENAVKTGFCAHMADTDWTDGDFVEKYKVMRCHDPTGCPHYTSTSKGLEEEKDAFHITWKHWYSRGDTVPFGKVRITLPILVARGSVAFSMYADLCEILE